MLCIPLGHAGNLGSLQWFILAFPVVMASSGHSVLDLTIYGRHLAGLEEKTLIRFFNDLTERLKIALTIQLNVVAYSK